MQVVHRVAEPLYKQQLGIAYRGILLSTPVAVKKKGGRKNFIEKAKLVEGNDMTIFT